MLQKAIVQEYYRRNVGFFLLIVLVAGGFMRKAEHVAIAEAALASGALLFMILALWLLYGLKIAWFLKAQLRQPSYQVVYHLRTYPVLARWGLLAGIHAGLMTPVWLYAVFMLYLGVMLGTWVSVGLILGFLLLLLLAFLSWADWLLCHPNPEARANQLQQFINQRFTWPYGSMFVRHLLHRQAVLLGLTKGFSVAVLVGVQLLYLTDAYDPRLLALGMLVSGLAHVMLVYEHVEFEHQHLLLVRNLPLSLLRRAGHYVLVYALLAIPEAIVLLRYWPVKLHYGWLVGLWWFGLAGQWLLHSSLLKRHYSREILVQYAFWALIGGFFAIMFRVPIVVLALGCTIGAGYWFRRYFYEAEYIVRP